MADVTSMDTRVFCRDDSGEPKYEVSFETHNRAFYEKVVAVCRECIDKNRSSTPPEYVDTKIKINGTDDKTFDIVDAFMHLIWGRKVRMTHWSEGEYIKLVTVGLVVQTGKRQIINQDGKVYPAELLFNKDSIEAKWEDYKEES